jgi:methionine-rich copper-binding protein CopC
VDRREFLAGAGCFAVVASTSRAYAKFGGGAFLDHAVPGVGLTVNRSPRELRLHFDLGVIAALSSVEVITSTGAAIPVSKPINDPSDQQFVIVRLGRVLGSGTYRVSWHMISINKRPTSGSFQFTVS